MAMVLLDGHLANEILSHVREGYQMFTRIGTVRRDISNRNVCGGMASVVAWEISANVVEIFCGAFVLNLEMLDNHDVFRFAVFSSDSIGLHGIASVGS